MTSLKYLISEGGKKKLIDDGFIYDEDSEVGATIHSLEVRI